jgi:hypothetical protein
MHASTGNHQRLLTETLFDHIAICKLISENTLCLCKRSRGVTPGVVHHGGGPDMDELRDGEMIEV